MFNNEIKNHKIKLMNTKLSKEDKLQFIRHLASVNNNFFYNSSIFNSSESDNIRDSIEIEKYYLLNLDRDSSLINYFEDKYSYSIFKKISEKCKEITNFDKIDKNINLNNYILIANFTSKKRLLEIVKNINEKEIKLNKDGVSFESIKINGLEIINKSKFIYDKELIKPSKTVKKLELLLIDKTKIVLINNKKLLHDENITFIEDKIKDNEQLLFQTNSKEYKQDKKIIITFPIPLDIKIDDDLVGYKFTTDFPVYDFDKEKNNY